MRTVFLLLSQRLRSFYKKFKLIPFQFIQVLVYCITSAQAKATFGAKLSDSKISDLVMCSFLAILYRIVLGFKNRVFQFVVSFNLYLIYLFFCFLYEDFSQIESPYFYLIVFWKSSSFPVLIMLPISSSEGWTCMILPKTTLLSVYEKALRAYSDFQNVMKKQPLVLPSYYFGNFSFVIFPYLPNYALISYSYKV